MSQDPEKLNIRRGLDILRRRGLWVAVCVVLAGAAAFGYSKHQTKKYTATASIAFNNDQLSQEIAGLTSSSVNFIQQQASNLELLHLGDMSTKTAIILGNGLTEEQVARSISISGQTESSIASISATTASPVLSAKIANTYARQFVREQQSSSRQYYKSALALVHKQLAALSRQQRNGTDGLDLQNRAQSLGLLSELQPNTVQVAQEALIPIAPSSPKTSRNTLIGCVLGLLLGLGLALLLERLDPRIRDPEELESIYRLPLLGVVPRTPILSRGGGRDREEPLPTPLAEIFHMIRARLRAFNSGRDLRTVLVVSAELGEGKTTIAHHLASAAARMGSRVLLLEADLRHPTLAQQLDILPPMGLPDVLSGRAMMSEAIRSIDTQANSTAMTSPGKLDVLLSGPSIPPNPVELIESDLMSNLLARARAEYDLVVIDTPELTAVSDAFLLLSKIDGVVIIGRMGRSRRDVATHLRQVLEISGASLAGVVANDVKSASPSAEGTAYDPKPESRTSASSPSGTESSPTKIANA